MSVEADLQGYTPPISLWKLVEQHVDDHETDEIKSVLGADLVDETLELHTELNAFLEIWRDCRKNTDEVTFSALIEYKNKFFTINKFEKSKVF